MTEDQIEYYRNLTFADVQDENGIDVTLIDRMLSLSYTERLDVLQEMMAIDEVLTKARVKLYGSDPRDADEAECGGR